MTGTADALVLYGPRQLHRQQLALPELGDDDGLLRVEACGLCGTDHEQYMGQLPLPGPLVPGHEVVGVIEAAGAKALERWGVSVGERVAVEVFKSCRSCKACGQGDYRHCAEHGMSDMVGFVALERPPGLWGGYCQYLYLPPSSMLLGVPAGLDPVMATLFNPLGAGLRWAAKLPRTSRGDVVAVLGPGIRGLCSCVAAREAGAGFVLVTGKGRRDATRLALASDFGADLALDIEHTDPVRALREATGSLADVVIDVTAKAPAALAQAISLAKPGGTVILAGTRGSAKTPGFWPDLIVYKELHIMGALGVEVSDYSPALEILAKRRWPFDQLPRSAVGLGGTGALLEEMGGAGSQTPPVHAVVLPWD